MDEPFADALPEKLSVVELIIETMKQALLRGDVLPGQKLPSEPEMAEQFGVSRSAVREAMRALSALGVITVRHGSGTYVAEQSAPQLLNPIVFALMLEPALSDEFSAFRSALQLGYCQLAFNAPPEALRQLDGQLRQLEQAERQRLGPQALLQLALKLHLVILAASGNRLLEQLGRTAEELFFYTLQSRLPPYAQLEGGSERYQQLLAAIKSAELALLEQALTALQRYWQRVVAQTY